MVCYVQSSGSSRLKELIIGKFAFTRFVGRYVVIHMLFVAVSVVIVLSVEGSSVDALVHYCVI